MNDLKNRADELGLVMSEDAVAAGVGFGDALEDLKASLGAIGTKIASAVMPYFQQFVDGFIGFMPSIHTMIEKLLPSLTDAAEKLLPPIMDLAEQLLPLLMQMLDLLIPLIVKAAEFVFPLIVKAVELFSQGLTYLIEVILPKAKETFGQTFEAIKAFAVQAYEYFKPYIDALTRYFGGFVDFIAGVFSGDWERAWTGIQNIFGGAMDAIKFAFQFVGDILTKGAELVADSFMRSFNRMGEDIDMVSNHFKEKSEGIKESALSLVSFVSGKFMDGWTKSWSGAKDVFRNIMDSLKAIFKEPINWIVDGLNSFIAGINSLEIPDWVPGVGGLSLNLPTIPRLAVGLDYVPYDDFPAFLHRGEAVLTASEAEEQRRGKNGERNVTYYMYFDNVQEKDTAFRVKRTLQQQERLQLV